ncbi:MAG: dihydrofolate reductase [Balneolaceae bacterium]|nr:dihydrofolate reductase [Balneolaceae bacterium]
MNTTCYVYIAASLDGFIAGPDGDISWLEKPEYHEGGTPGLSYEEFIKTIDCIVMGRNTFEKVLTFGFWPYKEIPVTVLTTRNLSIPDDFNGNVEATSGSPAEVLQELAEKGKYHLYIDGGVTIQQFLKAGLIDEITITIIPIILGEGIPLFDINENQTDLKLIDANSSSNGFVQVRYKVENGAK